MGTEKLEALTHCAGRVVDLIRKGWRLRVPSPGGGPTLVIDTSREAGAEKLEALTHCAGRVVDLIRKGWRLRVPYPGGGRALVIDTSGEAGAWRRNPAWEVQAEILRELLASGRLWKLTEHRIDDRKGWREGGLDGLEADWYCLLA